MGEGWLEGMFLCWFCFFDSHQFCLRLQSTLCFREDVCRSEVLDYSLVCSTCITLKIPIADTSFGCGLRRHDNCGVRVCARLQPQSQLWAVVLSEKNKKKLALL
jgi:hypothetical protein